MDEHQQSYNILFAFKINKALITRPIKIKEKNNININNICFFQSYTYVLK